MSKKLFIGGLSWNTGDGELRAAFERFGELEEVKVIVDRNTNRSRGFGFITFQDEASAQSAIEEMDGTELDGRTIKVDVAQMRGPRRDGGGRGGPGGGGGGYRNRSRFGRNDRDGGDRNRW
ncbi:MAG: RNA-binding protein [Myxococcota bacterium]|nr:RNA-binding protein [Myxococcota bacterium]